MEKIKRLLLYAGATPEEFAQVQQEMHLYNYNRLVAFLAISIVFLLISAVYAVFSVVLAPNLPAYLIVLGISCLLLPITLYVGRRSRAGLQICLSLFLSSLYSLSIYLSTVTSPGGPATAFIAFLLTLPTLFILPPLENMCSVVIWDMLFFLFVSVSKDARIVQIDMLNGIIYGCISIIASTYVTHMMMQNFITRARLRYVAENDQTTGLRNRNAFEREQNDIPGRCRRTLSCVYMDINGLHELNNAMGHQAGDIMLREVADELKKQFGDELTYRMGGDEYVAFAPDLSEDRLHEKVRTFSLAIEQKDYHAALGWATCETASLRMENLLRIAETRMLHEAVQTVAGEAYASNEWQSDKAISSFITIASKSGKKVTNHQDTGSYELFKSRYSEIVKLAEVPSLTDGKGSFFAITDTKGAVHCILYNTGRGLLGAYFRETGEYKVYDEQKNIDNYLKSYASCIDSVISTVIGSAEVSPWSQQTIDGNLTA